MLYELNYSVSLTEIGMSVQIQAFAKQQIDYDYTAPNAYRIGGTPTTGRINPSIQFPILQMEKRAKRSDLVMCAPLDGTYRVLSGKTIEVLKQLKLPDYQVFPIKVKHKGKLYDYFAFRITTQEACIDWSKSIFAIVDKTEKYFEGMRLLCPEKYRLQFENREAWLAKKRALYRGDGNLRVLTRYVALNTQILEYDLFRMQSPVPTGLYCSERCKTTIEQHHLTGFGFKSRDTKGITNPSLMVEIL